MVARDSKIKSPFQLNCWLAFWHPITLPAILARVGLVVTNVNPFSVR